MAYNMRLEILLVSCLIARANLTHTSLPYTTERLANKYIESVLAGLEQEIRRNLPEYLELKPLSFRVMLKVGGTNFIVKVAYTDKSSNKSFAHLWIRDWNNKRGHVEKVKLNIDPKASLPDT